MSVFDWRYVPNLKFRYKHLKKIEDCWMCGEENIEGFVIVQHEERSDKETCCLKCLKLEILQKSAILADYERPLGKRE